MSLTYRGERPYYRRSGRVGGRVTSRYVGAGQKAVDAARKKADFEEIKRKLAVLDRLRQRELDREFEEEGRRFEEVSQ